MTTEATKTEELPIEVINNDGDDAASSGQNLAPPPVEEGGQRQQESRPEIIEQDPRSKIAARFKQVRVDKEPPVEATGDFIDPSQVYGQAGKQPEPQADQSQPGNEPQAPAKRKLKVNGQEREYSDEEVTVLAQKAAAAEDILEQAKERLAESKRVLETTRVHVSRQNPAEEPATHAPGPDPQGDPQNPADPLKEAIEQIQYGDPDKAKEVLGQTIADAAQAAVKQVSMDDRIRQDIQSDMQAHDDFVKKNGDLAQDPRAAKLIRAELLDGYAEDLRKIGVPDEKIPTDPTQLANHHRFYKLQGQPVRSVAKLLDDAALSVREFRGTPRAETTTPQRPTPETRIEVNLNRDDRRKAIPQQPQRANVQPVPPAAQPAGGDARKAAVERARAARGQV